MKRLEPNLLLAISTLIPLILLVMTASLYGEPGHAAKYVILAVVCSVFFVMFNGVWARRAGMVRPPMIHAGAPATAAWAGLFPMLLILAAGIPILWPGHDYGLLIIIAAVWFGVTAESALKARRAG